MKNKDVRNYKRKSNFLQVAPANYLIVCEGKQTEPNYFKGLKEEINKKYGDKVEVLIPNIDIKGTGMNTTSLVIYTQRIVNYSNKVYGQVWVVFDKDDYSDVQFDLAIRNCDYNVAWSNPNFELWLLAHFKKITRYISGNEVIDELKKEFEKNGLGKYTKNDTDIFRKVTENGKLDKAIKNCKSMEILNMEGQASERNPMTRVYKLAKELKEYLE